MKELKKKLSRKDEGLTMERNHRERRQVDCVHKKSPLKDHSDKLALCARNCHKLAMTLL